METPLGTRSAADVRMRDEYLRSGRVPFWLAVRRGLDSVLFDPWRGMLQYLPGPIGLKARQWYYRRKLGAMGKGVVISPGAEIVGAKNIYLDDFVCLGKKAQFYAPEGYIKIGKRCHISAWILGQGGVEIGNYVAASGAIISASDSHQGGFRMAGPMLPPDQRNVRKAKVVIEDDAFIGLYSIVLPGVTVGQGAIVGPHSLVVRNVKPWTVVMGSPATVIGEREPVTLPPPD